MHLNFIDSIIKYGYSENLGFVQEFLLLNMENNNWDSMPKSRKLSLAQLICSAHLFTFVLDIDWVIGGCHSSDVVFNSSRIDALHFYLNFLTIHII